MSTVAERWKTLRKEVGATQPDVANVAGISKQAIGQIENGQTHSPRPEVVLRVANHYGYEVSWLISGVGPRRVQPQMRIESSVRESDSPYPAESGKECVELKRQIDSAYRDGSLTPPLIDALLSLLGALRRRS